MFYFFEKNNHVFYHFLFILFYLKNINCDIFTKTDNLKTDNQQFSLTYLDYSITIQHDIIKKHYK